MDWDAVDCGRRAIDQIQSRVMSILQDPARPSSSSLEEVLIHCCVYCAHQCESLAQLHKQLAKRHKALPLVYKFYKFHSLRDALRGKPQRTHCQRKFALWTGLIHRIAFNSCPQFDHHRVWQVPPCDRDEVRQFVHTRSWEALFERNDLATWFRYHCVICARAFKLGKTSSGTWPGVTTQCGKHPRPRHPRLS